MIDPRELDVLRKEITKAQKIWRQRRGICREMAGNLADSMEKKDEEIYVEKEDVRSCVGNDWNRDGGGAGTAESFQAIVPVNMYLV